MEDRPLNDVEAPLASQSGVRTTIKLTTFKIAFMIYVLVCAAAIILSMVFMFFTNDERHMNVYSIIIFTIIGKWTGFLVARESKSIRKTFSKQSLKQKKLTPFQKAMLQRGEDASIRTERDLESNRLAVE